MAEPERPFDITWDDVRKARRWKLKSRILVFILILSGILVAAFWVFRKENPGTRPSVEATQEIIPIEPKPKEKNLCEKLKGWANKTTLRLGQKTQSTCK